MNISRTLLIIAVLALCPLLTGCRKEKEPASPKPDAPTRAEGTVVAVGDSLTAGYGLQESEAYPALLEQKLARAGYRWRVVNAGISGETTSGTLSRIDWILKLNPDVVILETGANDGLRGVSLQLVHRNLDQIVTRLQAKGVVVVLAGMQMLGNLGPSYTAEFASLFPRVAKEHGLVLVPFFLAGVAGDPALNQADGIHPVAKGYEIVADTVYPYLLQAIERKARRER